MRITLGDIDLIRHTEEDGVSREIRNVVKLSISGDRSIVELKIPGSESNVFQDLGRDPLKIDLEGRLVGPDSYQTLDQLRELFGKSEPLSFSSDISPLTEVTQVIIQKFSTTMKNDEPSGSEYSMTLREHVESKGPGETPPPDQDESARERVRRRISEITSGEESMR